MTAPNSPQDERIALAHPVAVHANMLRGVIAKPSIENIFHLYGRDALLAALRAQPERAAADMRERAAAVVAWRGHQETGYNPTIKNICRMLAEDIRALPLSPAGEGGADA